MFAHPVPRAALLLGAAGVLPFLWGLGTMWVPALFEITMNTIGPRFVGPFVLLSYGTVILCFMSGALWGLVAKSEVELGPMGYGIAVVPALWAFFFVGNGPVSTSINLIAGYVAVLAIDYLLWSNKVAPPWWMALRIPLTVIVVLCLGIVAGTG
ncbi:DUF3429 domain-containing protein [Actibacterium sp. 188UL27-1]|uniref:DUF3429 domain-containing protein n=1 Tax=Actibacterium sp. 188UL27-1 TaxID=2786961 RepID=UPI001957EB39|nr:DUF3429 domain-containing protein [Actibacterium sp. 188UL27-1]MBM7067101.1 DUF3429 domain-containing protein [Actibacterium sp. 188UL27-1]